MKGAEKLGVKVFLFIVLFSAANFYVLSKLFILFGLPKDALFYAVWIVLSLSYVISAALLREFNNFIIKALNVLVSAWMGIIFMFLWLFLLYDFTSIFVAVNFYWAGLIIIAAVIVLSIYSVYNITSFSIRTIRVESEKLSRHFRIVQLSDLHIGSTHKKGFLAKTVERMNALNPDFVVVTGDLIDGMHKYKNNEFAPLSGLNVPSFFVLGNHEQFISLGEVYELLSKTDLKIMRNRALVQNGIQIVGIDDTSSREEFRRRLAGITIDHNRFSLLLYHRPNGFDAAADAGIDLMLSGHTHGGQIFPLNILLAVVDGPVRGLHRKKDTHLYVSTGAGWWGAPMRLGSRNELVVIDLIPKKVEEKIEEKETEDLERKEEHMEAVLNEKPGGRGKSQYKGKGRKGGKEKHREKIKKALFVNKDVDDAQIVSLRRGKRALRESKHEHILFSVDRLVEDIEMKQKLGRRKRKKPAKPAKKATGKTKKAGKKQGGVKKQAPKRTKIKNKRRM